jgi:ribosomal protein S18 acetylase RimI-like enzyme
MLPMSNYQIIPITEQNIERFNAAVDSVARERKYLAFLEGPPLEMSSAFVLENLQGNWPHFVAMSEGKVVGWCDISSLHRPVFAHSGSLGIGILAPFRKQGIGEALMRTALEKAKAIGLTRVELTVREKNISAFALYKKIGFVTEGVHRNAVRIGTEYENLISMALLFE